MKHIWCCECGAETECRPSDMMAGSVWHCDECGKMFGCVRTRRGLKAWITISPQDADFHRIFEEPEEDE